ncbi:MAG: SiaB family protein kinase [Clostridiales bacterium]|nr:SiaB family protein kinase [Clostridiales bacterium]MCF8023039.1 SiaB family protein kinase [Clostridiales bacterium]
MSNKMFVLQKELREKGVLISFSGKFSQEIIEELGQAVKKYLETENHPKTDIYNVFSIFIEQTQNIKNYCVSKQETPAYEQIANSCIVAIGSQENNERYVCSGNLIYNDDIDKLEKIINELIGLDKQSLKKLYKQKLKQDLPPDSTSAGLGLIDVARKASSPLEYSIEKKDEFFSFFTLKAIV